MVAEGVSAYKSKLRMNIKYLWIWFGLYPQIYPRIDAGFQRSRANADDVLASDAHTGWHIVLVRCVRAGAPKFGFKPDKKIRTLA
jgi:hypothetical protein